MSLSPPSCTADVYTSENVDAANIDFTEVLQSDPKTVKWVGGDANADLTVGIDISDNDLCEDEDNFKAYLTNIVGGHLDTQCYTTVKITDDDCTYLLPILKAHTDSNTLDSSEQRWPVSELVLPRTSCYKRAGWLTPCASVECS